MHVYMHGNIRGHSEPEPRRRNGNEDATLPREYDDPNVNIVYPSALLTASQRRRP